MLAIRFRSSSVTDVSDANEVGRLMLVQGLGGLNRHVGLLHMKNLLDRASSPPNGIHSASSEKQRVPTEISVLHPFAEQFAALPSLKCSNRFCFELNSGWEARITEL